MFGVVRAHAWGEEEGQSGGCALGGDQETVEAAVRWLGAEVGVVLCVVRYAGWSWSCDSK